VPAVPSVPAGSAVYAVPVNVDMLSSTELLQPAKARASARAEPKANSFSFFILSSLDF
jgi:hypothetical protein